MKDYVSQPYSATVYGRPGCVQCRFTVKELERLHVPYNYIDIEANEVANEQVKNMGFTSLPVVVTNSARWSGFSPDKLRGIND